jgi:transposase
MTGIPRHHGKHPAFGEVSVHSAPAPRPCPAPMTQSCYRGVGTDVLTRQFERLNPCPATRRTTGACSGQGSLVPLACPALQRKAKAREIRDPTQPPESRSVGRGHCRNRPDSISRMKTAQADSKHPFWAARLADTVAGLRPHRPQPNTAVIASEKHGFFGGSPGLLDAAWPISNRSRWFRAQLLPRRITAICARPRIAHWNQRRCERRAIP